MQSNHKTLSTLYDFFFQLPAHVFVVLDLVVFVGTDCSTVPDLLVLSSV